MLEETKSSSEGTEDSDYSDQEWEEIIKNRQRVSTKPEFQKQQVHRIEQMMLLRRAFPTFLDFAKTAVREAWGWSLEDIQEDIAKFMGHPTVVDERAVLAARSYAKTTLGGLRGVYQYIWVPSSRVIISSAGEQLSGEVSHLVRQLLVNWDILSALKPDPRFGDRIGAGQMDINWLLKGPEKSPSLRAISILGNWPGMRADFLISDDVESPKNSDTPSAREKLLARTAEYSNVCQSMNILWLGTYQSADSIYRDLPNRGVKVRVWPARYPNAASVPHFNGLLAPYLEQKMKDDPTLMTGGGLDGTLGKVTCPNRHSEEMLCKKEARDGYLNLQLHYLLSPCMDDSDKYPLKLENLICTPVHPDKGYAALTWGNDKNNKVSIAGLPINTALYGPLKGSEEMLPYRKKVGAIDPAGGGENGDETVLTIGYECYGQVYIPRILQLPGGYGQMEMDLIVQTILAYGIEVLLIEENMGKGGFTVVLRERLAAYVAKQKKDLRVPMIVNQWEQTNKEKRIIDTLGPIMGTHDLIIDPEVFRQSILQANRYPISKRMDYTLGMQLAKITYKKQSLVHDDIADCLARVVGYLRSLYKNNLTRKESAIDSIDTQLLKTIPTEDTLTDTVEFFSRRMHANSR